MMTPGKCRQVAATKTTITITYARCSTDKQDITAQKGRSQTSTFPPRTGATGVDRRHGMLASAATTGENVTFHSAGTLSTSEDSFGSAQRTDRNT
jgi:hypothetical protein